MKKLLLIGLAILFVVLFIAGCNNNEEKPPVTIGPAILTITNNLPYPLDAAWFNGTSFAGIPAGESQTQDITSGEYCIYVEATSEKQGQLWFRSNNALRINAGDDYKFTVTKDTFVIGVLQLTIANNLVYGGSSRDLQDASIGGVSYGAIAYNSSSGWKFIPSAETYSLYIKFDDQWYKCSPSFSTSRTGTTQTCTVDLANFPTLTKVSGPQ